MLKSLEQREQKFRKQRLQEQGIKDIYYHDPGATVCLLINSDGVVIAKGIAWFLKKKGRMESQVRAMRALKQKGNIHIDMEDRTVKWCGFYQPILTPFEIQLIRK